MKTKHLVLFLVCCLLLYIGEIFAGSLLALALLYQLNILFNRLPLTKESQWAAFKLFLFSIPLFFFLGGIHSFITLYFKEGQWLYLIFASVITYFLFFLVNFSCLFVFQFLPTNGYNVSASYQAAAMQLKNKKKGLFVQTLALFVLSFVPYLYSDWKIIFALTALQLFLHREQLKPAAGL